ncbi:hypothetical protein LTR08_003949 [Meristemomyces frigidus]|nr:hypothetical protein LTR08_003949 [Meristemomyces frigidus]
MTAEDLNLATERLSHISLQPDELDTQDEGGQLVDTPKSLKDLIDKLVSIDQGRDPIYMDLEGVSLSRHGSISLIQIYLPRLERAFIVDVTAMGFLAFDTAGTTGATLKSVLESTSITKCFFDVRNDSDALYSLFGVQLAGVRDIQLLELASRRYHKRYVRGLADCIKEDCPLSEQSRRAWQETKTAGIAMFDPKIGGSYEVFDVRPLDPKILEYCVQDVRYLPLLTSLFERRLNAQWRRKAERETARRLEESRKSDYKPNGQHKKFAVLNALNFAPPPAMFSMRRLALVSPKAPTVSEPEVYRLPPKEDNGRFNWATLETHYPVATLVDTLDTLWIIDIKDEFREAADAAVGIDFSDTTSSTINVFETTIRYLGGFLAAYDLSGDKRLLDKSLELAHMLYAAFDTPNRMPITRWDFHKAASGERQTADDGVLVAEIGSLTLGFTRLAQITNDNRWYDAVARIMTVFDAQQSSTNMPGMWPLVVNARAQVFNSGTVFTLGAMSDSVYEYLPKMYALLRGLERYARLYTGSMSAAIEHSLFRPMLPNNADVLVAGPVHTDEPGKSRLEPQG